MRPDPHAGKLPGLGCGCDLCKQPHTVPLRASEPGTPEHLLWMREQEHKRAKADAEFAEHTERIGRPDYWGKGS